MCLAIRRLPQMWWAIWLVKVLIGPLPSSSPASCGLRICRRAGRVRSDVTIEVPSSCGALAQLVRAEDSFAMSDPAAKATVEKPGELRESSDGVNPEPSPPKAGREAGRWEGAETRT